MEGGIRGTDETVTREVDSGIAELVSDPDVPAAWTLCLNGTPQSHVDLEDPTRFEFEYVRRLAHVADLVAPSDAPLRAMHLGGGAGSLDGVTGGSGRPLAGPLSTPEPAGDERGHVTAGQLSRSEPPPGGHPRSEPVGPKSAPVGAVQIPRHEVPAATPGDEVVRPGETLAGILACYEQVVASVPDLSATHPLPAAPWHEPGGVRSVRRVLLHVIAETAQHAGHADILRETLDGQKST